MWESPWRQSMAKQISMNPRVARGLPCIAGTQIPVTVFLELFKKGYTPERITTECYPELSQEDLTAAIDFMIDWVRRAPMYLPDMMENPK